MLTLFYKARCKAVVWICECGWGCPRKSGPPDLAKGSKPGYPRARNSTDIGRYFFVRGPNSLSKKITPHFRNEGASIRELRDFSMLGPRFYTIGPFLSCRTLGAPGPYFAPLHKLRALPCWGPVLYDGTLYELQGTSEFQGSHFCN